MNELLGGVPAEGAKMDIYRCQRMAQEIGFDSATFKADFPAGTFDCTWLDAYMGFVRVDADGVRDGFMTVDQLDGMFPDLNCHSLSAARDHPAGQQGGRDDDR